MLAYWKLLMRNRLKALSPKSLRKEGQKAWKAVLGYIAMALLFVFVYGMVLFMEMIAYDVAKRIGEPQAVIALALLGCTLVTLIYSFFYVMSVLFFGKDNAFVGALPISSHGILAAKLSTVLMGEAGLSFLICAPLMLRYGIETGAAAGYYVRMLVGQLLLPVAPVCVSTLLSFLLIRISALWKRREGMTTVMSFLLLGGIIAAQMSFTLNADDEQINAAILKLMFGQTSITNMVLSAYPPLKWLTESLTLSGAAAWGRAGLFAGLSIAALFVVIALCGGGYMRLALKQEESIRRVNSGKKRGRRERVRSPFWALYRQEMREVITVPTYATNCLTGAIMFPVMLVAMILGMQKEIGDSNVIGMLGGLLNAPLYLAIATGFLCFTGTMGLAAPSAVSREGKRHALRLTYPVSGGMQLAAKLLMGVSYNLLSAVISAVVLWVLFPQYWAQTLIALVISQVFSALWCMVGLLLDVYHPKLNWKTETEAVKQSVNGMLSMLVGLALVGLYAGITVLFGMNGLSLNLAVALSTVLMALGCALLGLWLRGKGARTYCLREYTK